MPYFTIGHSTRGIAGFIALLHESEIGLLVDVRKYPRSASNPQFNEETLPDVLMDSGVSYLQAPALGGRRPKAHSIPRDVNGAWRNSNFHNYADYALSQSFREGLEMLRAHGQTTRCAIMCSEAVWWRCHRRIIADYLLAAGETVYHILGPGRVECAQLSRDAVASRDGLVTYPGDSGLGHSPDTVDT